jgi:quercetin dioxygenase-like cupin family protein
MRNIKFAVAVIAALLSTQAPARGVASEPSQQLAGAKSAKITPVYSHALPGVPGKSLKGVLVDYGPGGFSPPHRHAKSAIIYATVLEGAVRCQLNGGPIKTYHAGDNWTEMPGDHHLVSANASDTQSAKVLAVFVVDDADTALTTPDGQ